MEKHLKTAKTISQLLDQRFNILGFRFGLDPLLGLIPGAGDVVAVALSLYILWVGRKMKIKTEDLWRMAGNVVFDLLIGTVPVIGDVADFFYQANVKNMEILEKYEKEAVEGEIID